MHYHILLRKTVYFGQNKRC